MASTVFLLESPSVAAKHTPHWIAKTAWGHQTLYAMVIRANLIDRFYSEGTRDLITLNHPKLSFENIKLLSLGSNGTSLSTTYDRVVANADNISKGLVRFFLQDNLCKSYEKLYSKKKPQLLSYITGLGALAGDQSLSSVYVLFFTGRNGKMDQLFAGVHQHIVPSKKGVDDRNEEASVRLPLLEIVDQKVTPVFLSKDSDYRSWMSGVGQLPDINLDFENRYLGNFWIDYRPLKQMLRGEEKSTATALPNVKSMIISVMHAFGLYGLQQTNVAPQTFSLPKKHIIDADRDAPVVRQYQDWGFTIDREVQLGSQQAAYEMSVDTQKLIERQTGKEPLEPEKSSFIWSIEPLDVRALSSVNAFGETYLSKDLQTRITPHLAQGETVELKSVNWRNYRSYLENVLEKENKWIACFKPKLVDGRITPSHLTLDLLELIRPENQPRAFGLQIDFQEGQSFQTGPLIRVQNFQDEGQIQFIFATDSQRQRTQVESVTVDHDATRRFSRVGSLVVRNQFATVRLEYCLAKTITHRSIVARAQRL